ncbi:MAG: dihydrofolate reductase family protein [Candidatus Dormibacteria bacterium]|jgi:dihydrofolate reductase
MSDVVVSEFITLDGVIEGPGNDPGFDRSGWAFRFSRGPEGDKFKFDEVMAAGALLLGRTTYEGFAAAWPTREGAGEFGEKMNSMPKYVVSSTLKRAEWYNSTILGHDLAVEVDKLKERIDGDILINGSAQLVQGLIELGLVDEYRLMVFPIVLGAGKRLFCDAGQPVVLQAVDATRAGDTMVLTYRSGRPAA